MMLAVTERALAIYFNKAADLAEAVKSDIQKTGKITNKTVLALNAFHVAANNIADLVQTMDKINKTIN